MKTVFFFPKIENLYFTVNIECYMFYILTLLSLSTTKFTVKNISVEKGIIER